MSARENYLWGPLRTPDGAMKVLGCIFVGAEALVALQTLRILGTPFRSPALVTTAFGGLLLWMFLRRSVLAARLFIAICGFSLVSLIWAATYWNTHARPIDLTPQIILWSLALFIAFRAHAATVCLRQGLLEDVAPIFD